MKATIVTIGDEILIGQIVDTNSGFIAKSLEDIGIQVHEIISISDSKEHILDTLCRLQNKVDFVIVTGGLGPTKDDITKKTFCDYFNDTLVLNKEVEKNIEQLFAKINYQVTQVNRDQALVPSTCMVLHNSFGTAPGMWLKKENTVFVSLPGVPYEMKGLIVDQVIPKIVKEYKRPFIIHKTILTYGEGESVLAARIENWEDNLPDFIKLAYLPSPGKVRLRLTARGADKDVLQTEINSQINKLTNIIGEIIVGFDDQETIEVTLGRLLKEKGFTLSLAESCTGGKISQVITSVSGSSNYYLGGIVSYATEAKLNVLKVSKNTIDSFSVVSKEVAIEMALQSQKIFNSNFAISTTGNAGPLKGDSSAEIGTVYIAIAKPNGVLVEEFNFGQPREKVIDRTVNKALEMLQKEILKNY